MTKLNPLKNLSKKLYKLRLKYPKGTPMNIICKLIKNSLSGRFGINPLINVTEVIEMIDIDKYYNTFHVLDSKEFDNGKCIITYYPYENKMDFYQNERITKKQVSLPISIFTTAYGRIHITKYMNRDTKRVILHWHRFFWLQRKSGYFRNWTRDW